MFARTVLSWSPFCCCRCTVFIGFRAPVLLQGKCGLPVFCLALHPFVNGRFAFMILGSACIFLGPGKDYVQTVSGVAMQYVACIQAYRDNIGAVLRCGGLEVVGNCSQGFCLGSKEQAVSSFGHGRRAKAPTFHVLLVSRHAGIRGSLTDPSTLPQIHRRPQKCC